MNKTALKYFECLRRLAVLPHTLDSGHFRDLKYVLKNHDEAVNSLRTQALISFSDASREIFTALAKASLNMGVVYWSLRNLDHEDNPFEPEFRQRFDPGTLEGHGITMEKLETICGSVPEEPEILKVVREMKKRRKSAPQPAREPDDDEIKRQERDDIVRRARAQAPLRRNELRNRGYDVK